MFASLKLIEMLAKSGVKLSAIAAEVPKINMFCRDISCRHELKGKVLRSIVDEYQDREMDLTDGVKIFHGEDWVLILPDPARPLIHVCCEADNEKTVQKLVKEYIDKIDSIL